MNTTRRLSQTAKTPSAAPTIELDVEAFRPFAALLLDIAREQLKQRGEQLAGGETLPPDEEPVDEH